MMTPSASAPAAPAPVAPAAVPPLTQPGALARNRARARARPQGTEGVIHALARAEIEDRLAEINRPLTDAAVVTGHPAFWTGLRPNAAMVADAAVLDLPAGGLDLIVHAMALHWADDPVGQIVQCARALRPDGLLMAVLPGGQTLSELRQALSQAEIDVTGGLSPRVLPMGDLRDLGALPGRAGLALPVADRLVQTLSYPDAFALMRDLRAMGETNALAGRLRRPTRRAVMDRAACIYADRFADPDRPGRIRATAELIFLTGWAPGPGQQKPLRPGSATHSLADALRRQGDAP